MASKSHKPLVILFGYHSSPFTQKIRHSLALKRIPYTLITVPSMLPRPLLVNTFNLTYRKIPVLAIGRDIYCDTSIILEALESTFPPTNSSTGSSNYGTLYPPDTAGNTNRTLIRGFTSFWIDRPLFRITTGLIPSAVWRTRFGEDRKGLIGHVLDADKLGAKIPRNLSGLDMHLSMFESHFAETNSEWIFGTEKPGLGDVSLFYQLDWGNDIAKGKGVENLTGGTLTETKLGQGATTVFNKQRYPALWTWFQKTSSHLASLPNMETRIEGHNETAVNNALEQLKKHPKLGAECMVKTPAGQHVELDTRLGLIVGREVSVAPDDTGRDNPMVGVLVGLGPEEVVVEPVEVGGRGEGIDVAVHFPRIGFVVKPVVEAKL